MIRRRYDRGQSMVELGILFAIVIGGLMAMRVFMQRGYQDRLKQATVYQDPETKFGGPGQYEPQYSSSNMNSQSSSATNRTAEDGGDVTATATDVGTRSGVEVTDGLSE